MPLGIYLSPWDMNSSLYENDTAYNIYYMEHLVELLNNSKYGNKGKFVEVWMDEAHGWGHLVKYWYPKWFDLIHQMQSDAVVQSSYASEVRTIGNEGGAAGDPCWCKMNLTDMRDLWDHGEGSDMAHGNPKGDIWDMGESDTTVSGPWFWDKGQSARIMEELTSIYLTSVGRGTPLLLNMPPNRTGIFPQAFVDRLFEFTDAINESFTDDFVQKPGVKASASSVWGNDETYGAKNVLSPDITKYWAMDNKAEGWLEIDLGEERIFDLVVISEHIELGQRIIHFTCEVQTTGTWHLLKRSNTIGAKRIIRTHPVKGSRLRFKFDQGDFYAPPIIERVSVFKAKNLFSLDNLGVPDGLILKSYANFDRNGAWISDNYCYVATGTDGKLTIGKIKYTSQIWVYGSTDPKYGRLEIEFDGKSIGNVSCYSEVHHDRQLLFSSKEYEYGGHKLVLKQVGSAPIAIHCIYFVDNGRAGMFELESKEYEVRGGKTIGIKVKRVGGSNGNTRVLLQTWSDTAIPNKDYKDISVWLDFANHTIKKIVYVETYKVSREGLSFIVRLSDASGGDMKTATGALVGFNHSARVFIKCGHLSKAAIGSIIGSSVAIIGIAIGVSVFVMRRRSDDSPDYLMTVSGDKLIKYVE
jgi:alpha-L-fucosidase